MEQEYYKHSKRNQRNMIPNELSIEKHSQCLVQRMVKFIKENSGRKYEKRRREIKYKVYILII